MKQVAVILMLLVINLFSCDSGFKYCYQKVKDLNVYKKDALYLPVSKTKTLVFSNKEIKNYIKKDSFLHLYLINSKTKYPFKINKNLKNNSLALINDKVECIKILQPQEGLKFGKISKKGLKNGVILNGCCFLVGIYTDKGMISKKFINHFLNSSLGYSTLGVRVKKCKNNLVVNYKNPFLKSPLEVGDIIVELNSKKITSLKNFNETILFSPYNKKITLKIKRCNKPKTIKAPLYERKGGGFLSDSFLESIDVYLDNNLSVISSKNKMIKKGDVIKMINKQQVKTTDEIKSALSNVKNSFKMGINRGGLEFFIKIDTNLKK
jgi:hypothetical protein